jgi:AraC-like DNA-binding protein
MEKFSYLSTLIIGAGIIQGIFLAIILIGIRKGNRKANRLLALLLLTFSINICHTVLFSEIIPSVSAHALKINEPFQFVLGPLMYFYVCQLTLVNFRLKPEKLLHFIPFILNCLLLLPLGIFSKSGTLVQFLDKNSDILSIIMWGLLLLQLTIYIVLSHSKIREHQKNIRQNYSETGDINLRWLKYLIMIVLIIHIVYYLLLVIMLHTPDSSSLFPHFQKAISIILSLAIYCIGYRGLSQPKIFNYEPVEMQSPETNNAKYERSGLDTREAEELSKRLVAFMSDEKPYLNSELTLPDLSATLDIPRNKLSQVLNEKLGMSFYDFVNSYRIRQAKEFLSDPGCENDKIITIAFDSGFNSKAAFNNIFKKSVGITPSEYKRMSLPIR